MSSAAFFISSFQGMPPQRLLHVVLLPPCAVPIFVDDVWQAPRHARTQQLAE